MLQPSFLEIFVAFDFCWMWPIRLVQSAFQKLQPEYGDEDEDEAMTNGGEGDERIQRRGRWREDVHARGRCPVAGGRAARGAVAAARARPRPARCRCSALCRSVVAESQ